MRVVRYRQSAILLVLLLLLYQMVPVCIQKNEYFDEPAKAEGFFLMQLSVSSPELMLSTSGFRSGFRILPARKLENKICQINIFRLYDRVASAFLPIKDVRHLINEIMNEYFNGSKYKLVRPNI